MDVICPRCKTTKFQNPSLKMMVNVCGHALCESCVDLLFLKGSGVCPECCIPLRRNNFRIQLFEDPLVEKEVDIRKKVMRDYNKKEEDFTTLREYNDYLEDVETIIFNLSHGIDVISTNKQIEDYKKNNKEQIIKSKNKMSRNEYELEEMIEYEKQQEELRHREILLEKVEAKKKKIREKEALVDELMFSNINAESIIDIFTVIAEESKQNEIKQPLTQPTQFSSGIQFGKQMNSFQPLPVDEGPIYIHQPSISIAEGPVLPYDEDLIKFGYIRHVRIETEQDRAGGYLSKFACIRALQDAFAGLYNN